MHLGIHTWTETHQKHFSKHLRLGGIRPGLLFFPSPLVQLRAVPMHPTLSMDTNRRRRGTSSEEGGGTFCLAWEENLLAERASSGPFSPQRSCWICCCKAAVSNPGPSKAAATALARQTSAYQLDRSSDPTGRREAVACFLLPIPFSHHKLLLSLTCKRGLIDGKPLSSSAKLLAHY